MKNLLSKKLIACSIVAMMLIANANAQIVYTDVAPDQTFNGQSVVYHLDLNNDGIVDFDISHSYSVYRSGSEYPCVTSRYINSAASKNLNAMAVNSVGALALAPSSVIDGSLTWNDTSVNRGSNGLAYLNSASGFCSKRYSISSGNWYNQVDKYLALRININGLTYYGWARLSFTGASSFTIKDYSFNNIPNTSILAGESSCLVSSISTPDCSGNNITVPYTLIGSFNAANIVTAQLSDAIGSFANPVNIGAVSSNVSGSITAIIPAATVFGSAYRIRVTTTNPSRISSINGSNLIINTSLPASVAITANGSTTVCGGYVSLSTSYISGNSYQWKLNGINILNATSYSYSAAATGNYSCLESNGCGSILSNIISVTVNPVPTPAVTVTGPTVVCSGIVTINANIDAGVTYQWYNNSVVIPGATYSSYNATSSGYYYVSETNTYGCARNSNSISLLIGSPVATISPAGTAPICRKSTITLIAHPTGNYTYQWRLNGIDISGATSNSYTTNRAGSYTVKVALVSGGCFSVSQATTLTKGGCRLASDNLPEIDNAITIAPNPFSSSTKIILSLAEAQYVSLKIFDLNGRLVKVLAEEDLKDGLHELAWSADNVSAGVYLLQFQSAEFSKMEKLIITK